MADWDNDEYLIRLALAFNNKFTGETLIQNAKLKAKRVSKSLPIGTSPIVTPIVTLPALPNTLPINSDTLPVLDALPIIDALPIHFLN